MGSSQGLALARGRADKMPLLPFLSRNLLHDLCCICQSSAAWLELMLASKVPRGMEGIPTLPVGLDPPPNTFAQ